MQRLVCHTPCNLRCVHFGMKCLYAWDGDGAPLPLLPERAHQRSADEGTKLPGYARRARPSDQRGDLVLLLRKCRHRQRQRAHIGKGNGAKGRKQKRCSKNTIPGSKWVLHFDHNDAQLCGPCWH